MILFTALPLEILSRLTSVPPLALFKLFQQPALLPANVVSLLVENLLDAVENITFAKPSASFYLRQCGEANPHRLRQIILSQID